MVVWHMTGRCNLSCAHCYSDSGPDSREPEMNEKDAEAFIRSCAANLVPVLLLSGGEPLDCPNLFSYMKKARGLGLKITVSTNGTLIDEHAASMLARYAEYVGISLDGTREIHDEFRGRAGAFDSSVSSIERLASRGCRVGARVTLARQVIDHLDEVLAVMEGLPTSRICFYRFIRSGRGARGASLVPDSADADAAARRIIEWADGLGVSRGSDCPQILTVGDASDSVRVYEYLDLNSGARLRDAAELMERSAGRPSGAGILSVRWDGAVFRNQFLWDEPIGCWNELALAARAAARRDTADECSPCGWR
ncbi:MAG: radical SAM protein, partial [Synergistaceae bacterium]|nr:radical SAM protein [Synergistaceae bacterium]